MSKKTFSLGEKSVATHTREIDGNIADSRAIGSSIVVTQWSRILAKNYILNPVQTILNSPMLANPISKCKAWEYYQNIYQDACNTHNKD